jgi:hypothetical protein
MQTQRKLTSIEEAAKNVLESTTYDSLRKRYDGAYLSSLELDEYPDSFQKIANDFVKKTKLSNKKIAVVHDEPIGYGKFQQLLKLLSVSKIPFALWSGDGEEAVFFVMEQLQED